MEKSFGYSHLKYRLHRYCGTDLQRAILIHDILLTHLISGTFARLTRFSGHVKKAIVFLFQVLVKPSGALAAESGWRPGQVLIRMPPSSNVTRKRSPSEVWSPHLVGARGQRPTTPLHSTGQTRVWKKYITTKMLLSANSNEKGIIQNRYDRDKN